MYCVSFRCYYGLKKTVTMTFQQSSSAIWEIGITGNTDKRCCVGGAIHVQCARLEFTVPIHVLRCTTFECCEVFRWGFWGQIIECTCPCSLSASASVVLTTYIGITTFFRSSSQVGERVVNAFIGHVIRASSFILIDCDKVGVHRRGWTGFT